MAAIHDRWFKDERKPDDTGKMVRTGKQIRTAEHGCELRWQVRWRDPDGKQCKQSFAKKAGKDPEVHAEAFLAKLKTELDTGDYVSPVDANTTFEAFAEGWRTSRTHGKSTARGVEVVLRRHAYAAPGKKGRTVTGSPAIGHLTLGELARRPSLIQTWISGIKLKPGPSADKVISAVSSIFAAALDDGLVRRNPLTAKSVTRPKPAEVTKAVPWTAAMIDAQARMIRDDGRRKFDPDGSSSWQLIPYLGAATGARQGEIFGLAESDIDFRRRVITVQREVKLDGGVQLFAPRKNGGQAKVPIPGWLLFRLRRHINEYPPVSVTLPWEPLLDEDEEKNDGRELVTFKLILHRTVNGVPLPLHRNSVNNAWKKAAKRAGNPVGVRKDMMHVMRHTAASAWLSDGLGIPAVAAFLGDTEAMVLKTYAHMMPDDQERGRKAMEKFFQGTCAPDVPEDLGEAAEND